AERDHDVERVVEKLDVIGPHFLGILVQTVDETSEMSVSEKTERARDLDGIVKPLRGNIRLSDNRDTSHRSADEPAFHGRKGYRLMVTDHLGLLIAAREGNQKRSDQTNESSGSQIKFSLDRMEFSQS